MSEPVIPRVMIGLPMRDYPHAFHAMSLAYMTALSKISISLCRCKSSVIPMSRNMMVHIAKTRGHEFLLMIDDDLSFPSCVVDRMVGIADDKGIDVLGCNYVCREPPHNCTFRPLNGMDQELRGLDQVDIVPGGMMLIRMSALSRMEEPYFLNPTYRAEQGFLTAGTEDTYFCDHAREAGLKIWMDTELSLSLVHWDGSTGVQWTIEPPGYKYVREPPT